MLDAAVAFEAILGQLYDCALDPGGWLRFVETFRDFAGAAVGQYFLWNTGQQECPFAAITAGVAASTQAAYYGHYAAIDPRLQLAHSHPNEFVLCHEHFDANYVARNEFYSDFLIPAGLRYLAGLTVDRGLGTTATFALLRATDQQPFSGTEVLWLQRLRPHLARAAELHMRLGTLQARAALGVGALNTFAYPLFVVDETCRTEFVNVAGERFLAGSTSFGVNQGCLRPREPKTAERLNRIVRQAIGAPARAPVAAAVGLQPGDGKEWQALALPLKPLLVADAWWQQRLALVVIIERGKRRVSKSLMQLLYGLTAAETDVASALAQGKSLDEIAASRRVTIETLRAQLKVIFQKTGTHRQAELVATLREPPELEA